MNSNDEQKVKKYLRRSHWYLWAIRIKFVGEFGAKRFQKVPNPKSNYEAFQIFANVFLLTQNEAVEAIIAIA